MGGHLPGPSCMFQLICWQLRESISKGIETASISLPLVDQGLE